MGEFEYMMLDKLCDRLLAQLDEAKRGLQYYANEANWRIGEEGHPTRRKSVPPWVEGDRGAVARTVLKKLKMKK